MLKINLGLLGVLILLLLGLYNFYLINNFSTITNEKLDMLITMIGDLDGDIHEIEDLLKK